MNSYLKICVKEIVHTLLDGQWHELYYFHQKYRAPIKIILESVGELLETGLIIKSGRMIKLKEKHSNQDLKMLNFYFKTKKPNALVYSNKKIEHF
ncbi:hypothetical protein [Lelliottia sp. CFBP8978]|uniref:hypothetical protein n=1 Tax=Lelliottia sp. CFBP8978 TaxID=3096522 RepID=UPI002A69AB65|nr:hypothetical protein [Lelliottia sp. CFBP8978]MDY1037524.1 hypothetical protein [Lelliottia sp. CFBP8978]